MTDPKLIEAVAKALCIANGVDPDSNISHLAGDKAWHAYQIDAAAAISAYEAARGDGVWVPREPTREMLRAAMNTAYSKWFAPGALADGGPVYWDFVNGDSAWKPVVRAMIAAAKGE